MDTSTRASAREPAEAVPLITGGFVLTRLPDAGCEIDTEGGFAEVRFTVILTLFVDVLANNYY